MLEGYILSFQPSEGMGVLEWVVIAGSTLVIGGTMVYRVLARWQGWWSDDK